MEAYNNMLANAQIISQNMKINPVRPQNTQNTDKQAATGAFSFNEVLQDQIASKSALNFSKHAALRINGRDIKLSNEQINRVEQGVNEAMSKGIKDSLVLVDDVALLVNVNSRTVVTAINQRAQNVFTNIDGTVIV